MPTLGTWKARQARASARKLARKLAQLPDVQWLALGQGKPVPQPLQAMQEAVARAERQPSTDLPPTAGQWKLARFINGLMGGAKGHV